jgi:uncharacterized protein (TIGR03067 family)
MRAGVLILAAALAPADPAAPPDAPTPPEKAELQVDLSSFQGSWTVIGYRRDGHDVPARDCPLTRIIFSRDCVTAETHIHGLTTSLGSIRLDPSGSPIALDLITRDGAVNRGICRRDGDVLQIAVRDDDSFLGGSNLAGPRPTDFDEGAGRGVIVWTLRRMRKRPRLNRLRRPGVGQPSLSRRRRA